MATSTAAVQRGTSYFIQGGYFGENTILKLLSFGGKQRTGIAWNGLSPEEEAVYGRRYNLRWAYESRQHTSRCSLPI